jgi:hypothetical protein
MSLSVEEAKKLAKEHCRDIAIDAALTEVMDKTRSNSRIKKEEKKPVAAAELAALKLNAVTVILKTTNGDESNAGLIYAVPAVEDAFEQVRKLAQKLPGLAKQDYANRLNWDGQGREPTQQVEVQSDDAYTQLIGAVVYNAGLLAGGSGILKFPGSRLSPEDDAPREPRLNFKELVEVRRMEEEPDSRDLRAEGRDEVRALENGPAKQKKRKPSKSHALPGDDVSQADPKRSSKGKDRKKHVSPPPQTSNETESENDESVYGGPAPKNLPAIPVVQAVPPPEDSQDLPVVQAQPVPESSGRAKKMAKFVPSPEKQAPPEKQAEPEKPAAPEKEAEPEKPATPPASSDDEVQFVKETRPVHIDLSLDDD